MKIKNHQCELPWFGCLYRCPECGTWYHVVEFVDDENDLKWKGWEKLERIEI